MEKHLKDYLHLYLGCEVICDNKDCYGDLERHGMKSNNTALLLRKHLNGNWKPLLRPLSDMTEEEWNMYKEIENSHPFTAYGDQLLYSKLTNYIRSIYVDVDELIKAGLAIDKTTIKQLAY